MVSKHHPAVKGAKAPGKIQDEPRTAHSVRKEDLVKGGKKEEKRKRRGRRRRKGKESPVGMSQGHKSLPERAPNGQSLNNLSNKINNNSIGL